MTFILIIICAFIIALCTFDVTESILTQQKEKIANSVNDEDSYSWSKNINAKKNKMEKNLKTLKLIKPIVLAGFVVVTLISALISSIYNTTEQEIGFVSMFGQNTMIETAGIHFKTPFFSEAHIFDGTTQGMPIGYSLETEESVDEDSLMITSDFNFLNIDFYLEYRISDPIAYNYSTSDPEGLLKNIALSSIRNTVGQVDVDSAMTTGKSMIEANVFDDITEELAKHQTGITVTNVSIQDSDAPTAEVQAAFQAVEDAKQGADKAKNDANKYTNEQLPAAEASAAKIISSAEATKTERINQATEEVATFEALYSEYAKNPTIVKQRMYYDTLSEILPNMEIVIGKDSKVFYVTGSNSNVSTAAVTTADASN